MNTVAYQNNLLEELSKHKDEIENDPMEALRIIRSINGNESFTESYIEETMDPIYSDDLDVLFASLNEVKNQSLRKTIRSLSTKFIGENSRFYDTVYCSIILYKLKDKTAFNILLKNAKKVLELRSGSETDVRPLIYLFKLYPDIRFRDKIKDFILSSFDFAKHCARLRDPSNDFDLYPDNKLNKDTFLVISQAILTLPTDDREEFADLVFDAYRFAANENCSYGLNQISGYLAIHSTAFTKKIDIDALLYGIKVSGKPYQDQRFVNQTLYAKWYIEENTEEALTALKDGKSAFAINYAAAVLADLNYTEALAVLKEKWKQIELKETKEVIKEAIHRLETQQTAPTSEDRMIWMFETMSPTMRALGFESDSQFYLRTKKKNPEFENNLEESDSE